MVVGDPVSLLKLAEAGTLRTGWASHGLGLTFHGLYMDSDTLLYGLGHTPSYLGRGWTRTHSVRPTGLGGAGGGY